MESDTLNCLLYIANKNGIYHNAETLCAGLAPDEHLTPHQITLIAKRLNMKCDIVSCSLQELSETDLPTIFLKENGKAVLILEKIGEYTFKVFSSTQGEFYLNTVDKETISTYTGDFITLKITQEINFHKDQKKEKHIEAWLWDTIKEAWPVFSEILLATLLINIFTLATPLFIMNVYNRVIPNSAFSTLWILATGLCIIYIFDFIIRLLRSYFIDLVDHDLDIHFSNEVFKRVIRIKLENFPKSIGKMANTVRNIDVFNNFLYSAPINFIVDLPFVLLFLIVVLIFGGVLVLIPLVGIALILAVSFFSQKFQSGIIEQSYEDSGEKNAFLVESIAGIETIKSMCAENGFQERWEENVKQTSESRIKLRKLINFNVNFNNLIQQIVAISTIIGGVYLIDAGSLSIGALIACSILTSRSVQPFTQLTGILSRFKQARTALLSLDSIMQSPVETPKPIIYVAQRNITGNISFEGVKFQYPTHSTHALNDISFSIHANDHVAIIGKSAAGKSTIAKLILKLYKPTDGRILLDGVDINEIDPYELRYFIGYVPEDIEIFQGTIRDNILIGNSQIKRDEFEQAILISGVKKMIERYPEGLKKNVGERGCFLSRGQRQAIAIARAVLKNPTLLILDEPSHSLDVETTYHFTNHLKEYIKNKTTILITHNSKMLDIAKRIILLESGKVILDGDKDSVISKITSIQQPKRE